jgi:uncharacterized protein YdhG (YjbR/CyaY superfamily)
MVSSKAATPEDYIAELPPERAALVAEVRDLVNANLPPGYREGMGYGMIGWVLPLERYPDTYNGQPLVYAGLAAQKNHTALYLNCIYASEERTERLRAAYAAAGKKLDVGKSCIRFKRREDLAEDALSEAIRAVPVEAFIAEYEASRTR